MREEHAPRGASVTPLRPDRPDAAPRSRAQRVWAELRRHPYAWLLTIGFAGAGAVLAPMLFPGATPAMGIVGGLAFGVYAALCAVPNKFLG